MISFNPGKYLEIIENYKTQATALVIGVFIVLVFIAGRATVDCPSKEVVCKSEIATIEKLFAEIEKCQNNLKDKLREQRDEADKACDVRIRGAIEKHRTTANIVTCEEVIALMPQCKKRGRRKWKT